MSVIEMIQYKDQYLPIMLWSCQRSVPIYLLSNYFMLASQVESQTHLKEVN
jgi:hypothetical protein